MLCFDSEIFLFCVNRYMADSGDIPLSSSEPKKRMVRGCTKMTKITKVRKTVSE